MSGETLITLTSGFWFPGPGAQYQGLNFDIKVLNYDILGIIWYARIVGTLGMAVDRVHLIF